MDIPIGGSSKAYKRVPMMSMDSEDRDGDYVSMEIEERDELEH